MICRYLQKIKPDGGSHWSLVTLKVRGSLQFYAFFFFKKKIVVVPFLKLLLRHCSTAVATKIPASHICLPVLTYVLCMVMTLPVLGPALQH